VLTHCLLLVSNHANIDNIFYTQLGVDFTNRFTSSFYAGRSQKHKKSSVSLALLRSGVNFINIQRTAFMLVDPKSVKNIDNLTVFFTLLGSASVKSVCRMLMKLSPALVKAARKMLVKFTLGHIDVHISYN